MKIGDSMRVEKWIYKGQEIYIPILEENEIETNEDIHKQNELQEDKEKVEDINEQ